MQTKRLVAGLCFAAAAFLAAIQCASAARIYNFLNIPVEVRGAVRIGDWGVIKLKPEERSDSISWSKETMVFVDYDIQKPAACQFQWFPHAELQGGNYLVISQRGRSVSCVLCNASHNVMYSSSGTLPSYVPEHVSSHHGC